MIKTTNSTQVSPQPNRACGLASRCSSLEGTRLCPASCRGHLREPEPTHLVQRAVSKPYESRKPVLDLMLFPHVRTNLFIEMELEVAKLFAVFAVYENNRRNPGGVLIFISRRAASASYQVTSVLPASVGKGVPPPVALRPAPPQMLNASGQTENFNLSTASVV